MNPVQEPGWKFKFLSWFRLIMALLYILIGCYVLSGFGGVTDHFSPAFRYSFGSLLLLYGGFRGWRILRLYRRQENGNP